LKQYLNLFSLIRCYYVTRTNKIGLAIKTIYHSRGGGARELDIIFG